MAAVERAIRGESTGSPLFHETRILLAFVLSSFCTLASHAASAKAYQVTGPVIALTDSTSPSKKGDEQWELARDAKTKSDSSIKVGDKVTVRYRMTAVDNDVKTTGNLSEPSTKTSVKKAANNADTLPRTAKSK